MSYLYPRRRSLHPFLVVLILTAGVALGLGAACFVLAPRIVSVSPDTEAHTGSYAAIEILFSVPMGAECSADHFSVVPAVEGDLSIEGARLRFAPKDPWPADTVVRASIQPGACSRRGLPLLAGRTWSFTPSLVRVAYIPIGESGNRLMGVPADGGDPVELAEAPAPIQNYDVSPRGDFAVLSTAASDTSGNLWITRLDGQPAELLLDCEEDSCRDPAVSPDGSLVAFIREPMPSNPATPPRIELLTIAARDVRAISPAGNSAGLPIWSAQGWLSYYDETLLLTVVDDLAGGRTVVPNAAGSAWTWLPDGSALILPEISVEDESGDETNKATSRVFGRLVHVELKTNQRRDLSGADLVDDLTPAVSPGGGWLAFSRNFFDGRWTPGRQLWIMDLADLTVRQISPAPDYTHSSIHWSRDGSQLAFMLFHATAPADPPEIWCVNADGSDPRRLAVGAFLPQWLP